MTYGKDEMPVTDAMIEAGRIELQEHFGAEGWDLGDAEIAKIYRAMHAARQPIEAPSDIGLVERFGLLARLGKHADALEGDPRAALWVSDIRDAADRIEALQRSNAEKDEALAYYAETFCEGFCEGEPEFAQFSDEQCSGCRAKRICGKALSHSSDGGSND